MNHDHLPAIQWLVSFALAIAFAFAPLNAQSCLPEGITFTSQAQLDAFPTDYPGCTVIEGTVLIEESKSGDITQLNGLTQVVAIGQYLEIRTNNALTNLQGLESLVSIGGRLNIASNITLSSLSGLENLSAIGASLGISSNHALKDIEALSNLQSIAGDLSVSQNERLASLAGLDSITAVGGHLIIRSNPTLQNLTGLDAVASVGKVLQIDNNRNLTSLEGLASLTSVGEDLIVDNNPALTSLRGLNKVQRIGRYLQIVNNASLSNLNGLNGLTSVRGLVQVYNNPSLISLAGIDSIDHSGIQDLALIANEKLSDCSIASICDYLGIASNLASISENDEFCNSREVILRDCDRDGATIISTLNKILFFPNPTRDLVEVKGAGLTNAGFRVTDSIGRHIFSGRLENNQIDLSNLAAGIYFIKLTTEKINVVAPVCKAE
jgi:hypothetical protein